MLEINFTKLFDVKAPQGFSQRNETEDNYSIGCDLHLPEFSPEFISALIDANKSMYGNLRYDEKKNYILNDNGMILMQIFDDKKSCEIYVKRIQIPSGIAIDIPANNFFEIRSKSSNFKNNYTVIQGTIDMNYTYGMGIQIVMLDLLFTIKLEVGQKIAQMIPVYIPSAVKKLTELSNDDFDMLPNVSSKRGVRTGGFGSTGKF